MSTSTAELAVPLEAVPRARFIPIASWVLYDFANTIFSFAIATRYFNHWIVVEQGGQDWYIAAMDVVITIALVVCMPVFGALADSYGRRIPFLAAFTGLSIAATASLVFVDELTTWLARHGMHVDVTLISLALGGIAIFAYNSALAQYDPLLAEIAPPEKHGMVSGFGVGIGYLGVILAIPLLGRIVGGDGSDKAFIPTAVLYGFFALPCLIFVRERSRSRTRSASTSVLTLSREAMKQLAVTIDAVRQHTDVFRLLAGRFLYVDALAVVITYMTIYLSRMGGFSEGKTQLVLLVSVSCAVIGGLSIGSIADAVGPRRVLLFVLVMFAAALGVAGGTGASWAVWIIGPIVGVGLAAVWTCDRLFMMRITPPAARGEFFGIYNLVGKVGGAIGPVIWGVTVWFASHKLGWGLFDASRLALIVLILPTLGGALIIRSLNDEPRDWSGDQLERDLEGLHA